MIKESFNRLFPDKVFDYNYKLTYSGHFRNYNANIRLSNKNLEISLSKNWKGINEEIVIGLIQTLLLKLFNTNKNTLNIDLYNNFIRSLHLTIPKINQDSKLEESFNRINNIFFQNKLEIPNLRWGNFYKSKYAHYNYLTDTITISIKFQNADTNLLDYLMYHESLHKKLKFKNNGYKTRHHTTEFKILENQYPNKNLIEKQLLLHIKKSAQKKNSLFNFFNI